MFLHDWSESGLAGLKSDFGISDQELEGVTILLASYTYLNHSGEAFVLFERDGALYEVHGSHCSCYRLGDCGYRISGRGRTQWQPEETTVAALIYRLDKGRVSGDYAEQLRTVLDAMQPATATA